MEPVRCCFASRTRCLQWTCSVHSWAKFVALHLSGNSPCQHARGSTFFFVSERGPEITEVTEVAGIVWWILSIEDLCFQNMVIGGCSEGAWMAKRVTSWTRRFQCHYVKADEDCSFAFLCWQHEIQRRSIFVAHIFPTRPGFQPTQLCQRNNFYLILHSLAAGAKLCLPYPTPHESQIPALSLTPSERAITGLVSSCRSFSQRKTKTRWFLSGVATLWLAM